MWAAVGLLAAGVAGLYASVLAAYSLYHLFNDATAFALLAVVSAIGIATGARSRLPVVSIVSAIPCLYCALSARIAESQSVRFPDLHARGPCNGPHPGGVASWRLSCRRRDRVVGHSCPRRAVDFGRR